MLPFCFSPHFPCTIMEKKPFIKVDELMPLVSLPQAAGFYGVELPQLHAAGSETRARCFLTCGKTHDTGDRALAIQADHPAKQWHCHQYGCGKSGNLVSLCDLMKPGTSAGGKPRGERFKAIAADIAAMVGGLTRGESLVPATPTPSVKPPEVKLNVTLKDSENLRARGLTELDRKFVTEADSMPPAASSYFRRRPFLSSEECRTKWRVGYLPRDAGDDKSGGTMRGKIVYPIVSESGDVLTWFGRDPEFEQKHKAWEATDQSEREPEKFHFVKGFHRGLELFGQHRLREGANAEVLKALGLVIVEGPNDAIRLDALGIPSVALCSNTITRDQAEKAARLARELAGGIVTVFLDCDAEGENGMKQCLGYLAQLTPVRLAWTSKMFGGKLRNRQPESLTPEEVEEVVAYLLSGERRGWVLA